MGINVGTAVAYLTLDRNPFQGGLRAAASELRNFVRGTGEIGGRIGSLGNAASHLGGTLTKAITLPLVGAGAACTKLAMNFETSMAKVQSIANASKKELKDIKKDILEISSKNGMDANEVAEATYQAISSGVDKLKATDFVDVAAKAAIAGFTDTATAVDGLSTVLNAYGKKTEEAKGLANEFLITQNKGKTSFGEMASVMGNIAPTAFAAGLSTKELNSSIAVLTANGIQTSQAVTGLKAAVSNIIKPSAEATKAAEALGMKFDVNQIKSKGWAGYLMDIRHKLEGAAPAYVKTVDEVNKLKKALAGSSKSSEQYTKQLDAERKKIRKLQEEKKGLTSKDKDRKKAIDSEIQSVRKHIDTLKEEKKATSKNANATKDLKKQLKNKEKQLELLKKSSNSTLSGMATMFGSVEALNSVLTMTSENGMKLYNDTMQEMNKNSHALDDAYDTMMESPERKMAKAKESLKNLGIELGGFLAPYVTQFADSFTKVISELNKLPGPVKGALVHTLALAATAGPILKLGSNFLMLGNSVVRGVGLLRCIPGILSGVATGSSSMLRTLVSSFARVPGLIRSSGLGIINAAKFIGSGVSAGIGGIIRVFSSLPALLSPHVLLTIGVIGGLGFAFYEIYKHSDTVKKGIKTIGNYLKNKFVKSIDIAKKAWLGFTNFLKHPLPSLKAAGQFVVDGFTKGVRSKTPQACNSMDDLAAKTKNRFKSDMGIHSPSRVFSEYGSYTTEGYVEGLDKTKDTVFNKVNSITGRIKELGKVKGRFEGIEDIEFNNKFSSAPATSEIKNISNSNSSSSFKFEPKIVMHVNISDTGKKGAEQLTGEIKAMSEHAIKNGFVDSFMEDALRSY